MEQHHTPEAAKFFATMARNEQKHGEELRARRHGLFGDAPRRVKRSMLWDVEAPDYDQPRAFMSARQAMEVALASETKAHEFFVQRHPPPRRPRGEEALPGAARRGGAAPGPRPRGDARPAAGAQEPDAGDYEDEPVAQ